MKYFHWFIAASLIAPALTACGDDSAEEPIIEVRPDANNGRPDPLPEPEPTVETRELVAISNVNRTVEASSQVDLEVLLRIAETQAPVVEENIRFTILQAPDTSYTLSADTMATSANGHAKVVLNVGTAPGAILVRAQAANVAPVTFTVNVADSAPGDIRVEIVTPMDAAPQLAPFRVRAYDPGLYSCATFPRLADAAGSIVGTSAQGTLVTLADVPSQTSYTVTVQAMGNGTKPLAVGCVDNVLVNPNVTTNIQVPIDLVPLDPTGTYTVTGFWDLSEAIAQSGDAGSIVVGLIDFLANPGLFVYNFVIDAIMDQTGYDLTFLSAFGVDVLVQDTINDWLFQDATAQRFRDVGIGLQTMLNSLEVESELVIDKRMADFTFEGYEHWQKIVLNLSWQCTGANPAPGCGRYEIPVDRDGNLPGLGSVNYTWTGTVTDYDQLAIASHAFAFHYGELLLTIIEQVAIPQLTGGSANTLAGALAHWIDCQGIAQDLSSEPLIQGIATQACNGAMAGIAATVTAPLLNQSVSFDLEFSGSATLVDGQSEGFVDSINEGHNLGTMVSTGAPVDVLWTAVLKGI